jgi:nucleoside-diphosphate-sugar epimerase
MRLFVTGATGFIGGRITRQLLAAGHEVIALVRSPERAAGLAALGVRLHPGDITDKESMREPMRGADGVFHAAAWYRLGGRAERSRAMTINVDGTRNVLGLMQELSIPRGVYTSSLAVFSDTGGRVVDETYRYDGPHRSLYDLTKWRAHYEVALPLIQQGLPLTIVQPGLVYGPGDTSMVATTLVQYLDRKLPLAPRKTAFCWGHVEDTARGHLQAFERGRPGETYIIGGPPHTLEEAFVVCERATGIPAPRWRPGPVAMQALAAVMGVLGRFVPLPDSYQAESLRVIGGSTYLGSSAKAARELGFTTRPMEEGLAETVSALARETAAAR